VSWYVGFFRLLPGFVFYSIFLCVTINKASLVVLPRLRNQFYNRYMYDTTFKPFESFLTFCFQVFHTGNKLPFPVNIMSKNLSSFKSGIYVPFNACSGSQWSVQKCMHQQYQQFWLCHLFSKFCWWTYYTDIHIQTNPHRPTRLNNRVNPLRWDRKISEPLCGEIN
jgi:hypothetical protein